MSEMMETIFAPADAEHLAKAGVLIAQGQLVAFPTETVYGLGANAWDENAVRAIFEAKGRPQDNPLIVHIAQESMLDQLVRFVPDSAKKLINKFWPGALTIILPKSARVSPVVTAGLDTVAVRMPSNPAARALIEAAGVPIAAPSANRSGLPSPTRAEHVYQDMCGRIAMILDGGACEVGLESAVIDLSGDVPILLRPGAVTHEMLCAVLGEVKISSGVLASLKDGEAARSPGLKHKHYAPSYSRVVLLEGDAAAIAAHIDAFVLEHPHVCAAVLKQDAARAVRASARIVNAGADDAAYASALFDALRMLDDEKTEVIFCQGVPMQGMGLALMNRLLRAAAFQVQKV